MRVSADPPADADLERLVIRFLAALVAVLLAAGALRVAGRIEQDESAATAASLSAGTPALADGSPVAPYIAARRAALGRLQGASHAVVSFHRYVPVEDAGRVIGGSELRYLLVAAPGGSPATIPAGDVEAWATRERRHAQEEAAEIDRLLPTVSDPSFVAQYRDDRDRLQVLAAGVLPRAALVFGAVVRGSPGALRRLAEAPDVRLVDPVTTVSSRQRGLRPEETAVAGRPPYRPLPAAGG